MAGKDTTFLSLEAPLVAKKIEKVSPEDSFLEDSGYHALKIICLGDSAVGKSK